MRNEASEKSISTREVMLQDYDNYATALRNFIKKGERCGQDTLYIAFLLGKITWILGDLYEYNRYRDYYRVVKRIGKYFGGRCFLYLEGINILSKKIDKGTATELIAKLLEQFEIDEQGEILETARGRVEYTDEEENWLARMAARD